MSLNGVSYSAHDVALFEAVLNGNIMRAKAALEAGASVNGSRELLSAPIAAAAARNEVGMVKFLIGRGADPDGAAYQEISRPVSVYDIVPGERALHIAAMNFNLEIVRALIRGGADPNATDKRGRTPLLTACACLDNRAGVVRLLLEAGADPALAEEHGYIPLHIATTNGHINIVEMLVTAAPCTLNRYSIDGRTSLFVACAEGHEGMVSRLLSLGATQPLLRGKNSMQPLSVAAGKGFEGVVRILIEEGLEAIGGVSTLSFAVYSAIRDDRARVVRLLLSVGGEEGQSEWANCRISTRHALHYGAGFCCPASVSVLLAAGADEAARDSEGRVPRDIIGVDLGREIQMDREKEVAVRRMLEQGPAYRARSWAWPAEKQADGGDCGGDGDGDAVFSSAPATKAPVGVRIFRPKSDRTFFVRVVGRYCEKD